MDGSRRTVHGARLDAELLAEVYLAMTGGQTRMDLAPATERVHRTRREERPALRVVRATDEELVRHEARLDELDRMAGGPCLWREVERGGTGS